MVQFYFNDDLIVNVDKDSLDFLDVDSSNDKYLLFKYFGLKHHLFVNFVYLTQNWIDNDLKLLNNQISQAFDCSFGKFEKFKNDCIGLLTSANVILMNSAQCILEYVVQNGCYHINKSESIKILTMLFFDCESWNPDNTDGYNFYNNLRHKFVQDKVLYVTYNNVACFLIQFLDDQKLNKQFHAYGVNLLDFLNQC